MTKLFGRKWIPVLSRDLPISQKFLHSFVHVSKSFIAELLIATSLQEAFWLR